LAGDDAGQGGFADAGHAVYRVDGQNGGVAVFGCAQEVVEFAVAAGESGDVTGEGVAEGDRSGLGWGLVGDVLGVVVAYLHAGAAA